MPHRAERERNRLPCLHERRRRRGDGRRTARPRQFGALLAREEFHLQRRHVAGGQRHLCAERRLRRLKPWRVARDAGHQHLDHERPHALQRGRHDEHPLQPHDLRQERQDVQHRLAGTVRHRRRDQDRAEPGPRLHDEQPVPGAKRLGRHGGHRSGRGDHEQPRADVRRRRPGGDERRVPPRGGRPKDGRPQPRRNLERHGQRFILQQHEGSSEADGRRTVLDAEQLLRSQQLRARRGRGRQDQHAEQPLADGFDGAFQALRVEWRRVRGG